LTKSHQIIDKHAVYGYSSRRRAAIDFYGRRRINSIRGSVIMKEHERADQFFKLWAFLRQTEWVILRVRQRELAQYNLTTEQAAVCFYIKLLGQQATPSELSRWILREPQTISGILARMAKRGLVKRVRRPHLKGTIRVMLTERGQQALEHATNNRKSIYKIFSSLSEEESVQLGSSLNKLRRKALQDFGAFKEPPFPKIE
jgi:DNA-binding MarR family transcriptional regulator